MDRHGADSLPPALGDKNLKFQTGWSGARLSFPGEMRYALPLGNRFRWNASTVMNTTDKRAPREDRRLEDVGPPDGWRERRKHVERRIPMALEVEVSAEDWEAYFVKPVKAKAHQEHEAAGDVFERARK
jgi:hypothetical protein